MRIQFILTTITILLLATTASAQEADVAGLAAKLSSGDKAACLEAADALGDLGADAQAAVPALVEALKNDDPEVCWHVCRALGSIGGGDASAVSALATALGNENASVRAYAA